MRRIPDPPTNLISNSLISSAKIIGLIWDNGNEDGGAAVLDYRVSYD